MEGREGSNEGQMKGACGKPSGIVHCTKTNSYSLEIYFQCFFRGTGKIN